MRQRKHKIDLCSSKLADMYFILRANKFIFVLVNRTKKNASQLTKMNNLVHKLQRFLNENGTTLCSGRFTYTLPQS